MLHRLIALGLIALLAGCAAAPGPTYVLRATASDGRDLSNADIDADTILELRQPTGVVSIQPTRQFSAYGAAFIVAVHNVGTAPQTFGPENIVVKVGGAPVTVYNAAALEEKVKRKVGAMMKAEAARASFSPRDIQEASYSVTHDRTYNNYGGCTAGNGACGIFTGGYNRYLQDESERAQNYEVATRAAALLLRDTAAVNQQVLKSSAVKPGDMLGGVVVIGHPRVDQTLDVVVTFGGQPHKFSFRALPLA